MLLKILTALIAIGVMVLTYFYVDAQKDGPCLKSLILKMIAATGYVAVGVLCIIISGDFSSFDKIMLTALICSWIGDLFLHMGKIFVFTVLGYLGFLSSHVFFIMAYVKGIELLSPDRSFFSAPEIIAVAAALIAFAIYIKVKKLSLPVFLLIPVMVYGAVIMMMFCKAIILGIDAYSAGISPFILISSILGALLFVMSDFSISIIFFKKDAKKNFNLKLFNMYTFFGAEILLGSLIYFI